jgi:hypothetical protein
VWLSELVSGMGTFQPIAGRFKLRFSHPDVFKDRLKTLKQLNKTLFILVVELTWATCFDLV